MQKRVIGYIDGLAAESYTSRNTTAAAKTANKTAATSAAKATGEAKTAKTRGGKSSFGKAVKFAVVCMLLVFSVFCAIGSADWIISQQVKFESSSESESYFNFDEAALQAHINIKAGEATTQSQSARAQKAAKNTAGVSTAKAATNYSAKTSSASPLYAANDENAATYANDENGAATYANESETSSQIGRATYNGAPLEAFVVTSGVANAAGELPEKAITSALTTKYVELNSESEKLPAKIEDYFANATEGMPSAAGTYAIYVTINGFKDLGFAVKIFTITPCPVAITWSGSTLKGFTYDGAVHTDVKATATVNTSESGNTIGAQANVTVKYDITRKVKNETVPANEIKNAGAYTLTAKLTGDNAGNYTIPSGETTKTTSFTVDKATLTVTANNKQITYGDNPPSFSVSYSGFVNGETSSVLSGTVAFACDYERGSKVDTYTITPSGLTSENYTITFTAGTLTVKPYGVKIEWSNTTVTYNGEAQSPVAEISNKIADLPAPELTLSPASATEAGTYTVTASLTGENAGNYTIASGETTTFVINKKAIEISITGKDITYGDDAPTSYSYTFGEGTTQEEITLVTQNIKFSCSYTKGSNAGKYAVTASVSIANYDIEVTPGTLTVNTAGLTLKANNGSVTYGEEPDANGYGYTLSGFLLNDTEEPAVSEISVSYTYNYTAGSDVGKYTITPKADKFTSTNYEITKTETGTLTVKPASVTVNTLIQKDYADGGVLFDGSLFSFSKEVNGGITVDLSNATAKNFTSGTASETAGLFEYSYGSGKTYIKAGSTYVISGVKFESKNYNVTNANADIYLKYKTAKVGSTYYTIEDALSQSGDIVLESNSTKNNTYVITAFTSLNYYSTTHSFTTSRNIIVPHEAGKTASVTQQTSASGNVGSVLIIPEGVSLTMNSSTLDILAIVGQPNQLVCTTGARGVVMNQGTLTVSGVINNGDTPNIRAYGYLKGSGNVITENSATVEDLFHIYDFKGGANTYGIYDSTKNYLPINAYSIHDISCNIKVNAGCVYNAYYEITMGGEWFSGLIPIVGQSNAEFALFKLSSGYIEKKAIPAKSDKTSPNALNTITGSNQIKGQKEDVKIRGNAVDGAIKITVALIKAGITLAKINMTTSPTSPLPIPYMDIRVCTDGNLSLGSSSYKFMPGSSLIVDEGGTLSLSSGSNLVFYSIADCTNYEKPSEYKNKDGDITTYPYNYITNYCVDKISAHFEINSDKVSLNGGVSGRLTSNYNNTKLNLSVNSATIQVIDKMQAEAKSLLSYKYPDVSIRNVTMYATGDIITGLNDTHEESTLSAGTYYSRELSDGTFVWFKNTATITYVLNGGKVDSKTDVFSENVTLSKNGYTSFATPTKNYYTFGGWYSVSACTDGNEVNEIFADCTLYAKWNAISYTIKYEGSIQYSLPENAKTQISGDEVYTLPTPENIAEGYFFKGWSFTKDDSTNLITSISAANANNGIITVYAILDNTVSYNLIFEGIPDDIPNKDFFANKTGLTETDLKNITLPPTSDLATNTKFDRVFVGWYTDEELTNSFDENFETLFTDKTTATLYAKWTYKAEVVIEYYDSSKNAIDSITVYLASGQEKTITLDDSYRFADENSTTSLTGNGTVTKTILTDRKKATISVNFTASETTKPSATVTLDVRKVFSVTINMSAKGTFRTVYSGTFNITSVELIGGYYSSEFNGNWEIINTSINPSYNKTGDTTFHILSGKYSNSSFAQSDTIIKVTIPEITVKAATASHKFSAQSPDTAINCKIEKNSSPFQFAILDNATIKWTSEQNVRW